MTDWRILHALEWARHVTQRVTDSPRPRETTCRTACSTAAGAGCYEPRGSRDRPTEAPQRRPVEARETQAGQGFADSV
jgi:hypothetical protein